jgi:hypothetical protein
MPLVIKSDLHVSEFIVSLEVSPGIPSRGPCSKKPGARRSRVSRRLLRRRRWRGRYGGLRCTRQISQVHPLESSLIAP